MNDIFLHKNVSNPADLTTLVSFLVIILLMSIFTEKMIFVGPHLSLGDYKHILPP